ncbi:hypothetical protein VA7868_02109 [Vibrio aerogenes CECT 7868]|uniref:Uncharacterized protein n=1 Tax=Vibrio aerogenes CECT 7868 TaxID=1216006 RepID=A0A1M5YZ42_9VIBR|nr:hypothetical protein [Vibrio aerogenes]SHI17225.1 hypothetical protein VA7868_02109 [Vibrio aerogenes CECT 7868]
MHAQIEKPKNIKERRLVADAVVQKKSNRKQGFGFVDNRSEAIQFSFGKKVDHSEVSAGRILQRKAEVVVDREGLKVNRDGDLKIKEIMAIEDNTLDKAKDTKKTYRHMSPKSLRLKIAENEFQHDFNQKTEVQYVANQLNTLQNALTSWEKQTEELGDQFFGGAEQNALISDKAVDFISLAYIGYNNSAAITDEILKKDWGAYANHLVYELLAEYKVKKVKEEANKISNFKDNPGDKLVETWGEIFYKKLVEEIDQTASQMKIEVTHAADIKKLKEAMWTINNDNIKVFLNSVVDLATLANTTLNDKKYAGPFNKNGLPNRTYYKEPFFK